ncbi:MAG: hypothetical protein CMF26_06685 [Kiloniella sp.]|nr:hypothetical protein [Kiloniella sp.]
MVSNFGNILNLIIFLVLTVGWAVYAFQMVFGTRAFFDRFNMNHSALIMGRFLGSFAAGALILHLVILFSGATGAWPLFAFFLTQGVIAALLSLWSIQSKAGVDEGVKYTFEPVVAPLVFSVGYAFLLFSMQDIVYA